MVACLCQAPPKFSAYAGLQRHAWPHASFTPPSNNRQVFPELNWLRVVTCACSPFMGMLTSLSCSTQGAQGTPPAAKQASTPKPPQGRKPAPAKKAKVHGLRACADEH